MTVAVVGGGIVGLAVAHEVLRRWPSESVTVFEKEPAVGLHQSGHNSGVIHAGLYYAPGSLKASLCGRGRSLLQEFCAEHGVEYRALGKLVVATTTDELPALRRIAERARENGVPDVAWVEGADIAAIEPRAAGVAAVHSPHTAVVDYGAVCTALSDQIQRAGGTIRVSAPVQALDQGADHVDVTVPDGSHRFDVVFACAGLGTDAVAAMVDGSTAVRILPFRGEYYALRDSARDYVRGMIYPVPDPRYPFLGVHLTKSVSGEVHVGPNAVIALALEGYRWRDVDVPHLLRTAAWPGTWRLMSQHWRTGIREVATSLSKRLYLRAARKYLPALTAADLRRDTSGVRAQAVTGAGTLVDDFLVEIHGRVLLLRNAPSPAATSSLAIAEHLVERAIEAGLRPS